MGSPLNVLSLNHQKKGREKENKISPFVYEGGIFNYFGNPLQQSLLSISFAGGNGQNPILQKAQPGSLDGRRQG